MNIETTVLVVDDDSHFLKSIRMALEEEGYRVLTAKDGEEALAVLRTEPADLILTDIAMPRMNGYQLYERVRENPCWVAIPFIFLTARAMDSDIRYGKALGVDDYLTKPFRPEDLFAVVQGKLRRAQQLTRQLDQAAAPSASGPSTLKAGRLMLSSDQHLAWLDGQEIKLSAREFKLLEHLVQRIGQVVSPPELIKITHDLDTDHGEAGTLLRPLIRSLRRKLGYPVGEMGCIENVRGVGYRLIEPKA